MRYEELHPSRLLQTKQHASLRATTAARRRPRLSVRLNLSVAVGRRFLGGGRFVRHCQSLRRHRGRLPVSASL